jgi:hypothetical protein
MTEKERILKNNKGELPDGAYDIVRVIDIQDSKECLQTFKEFVITYLENKNLEPEDETWEKILPKRITKFIEQHDYIKDDFITHICPIIEQLKEVRDWEWYSSKLMDNGFEVVMKGEFYGIFLPILHHMGIPHKSMFIVHDGHVYDVSRAGTDVMTYKTFDPKTFELKRK